MVSKYCVIVKFKYSESYISYFPSIYGARLEYKFWLKAQEQYNKPGCYNPILGVSIGKIKEVN